MDKKRFRTLALHNLCTDRAKIAAMLLQIVAVVLLAVFTHHAYGQGAVTAAECLNGTLRLVDGRSELEGRVELCYNEQWGTVCDDLWDVAEARVVCRQLGFSTNGSRATPGSSFPPGTGAILLDSVQCTGTERSLLNCTTAGIGVHDCTHFEDAGVVCEPVGFACSDGDVRLVGGSSPYEGRVELCISNSYGTVCDDGTWGPNEANVVCNQLQFGSTDADAIAISGGDFGVGIGSIIIRGGLFCNGSEDNLASCPRTFSSQASLFCSHLDDAGVLCPRPNATCENGDIRLVNGRLPSEGRVEVCFNSHWGTICHDGWGPNEARVVCSEIGYQRNDSIAIGYADFGRGEGLILLSNVGCEGSEDNLSQCPHSGVNQHRCNHQEDVGVICVDPNNTCTEGQLRLVGGDTPNEGRLEICYANHWGTICDDQFDSGDATVACRLLGFPSNASVGLHFSYFGEGVGIIFLDDVECVGNETSLLECSHIGIGTSNCFHEEDISLLCQGENASCVNGDIRLANGSGPHEGRVEVCYNGRWGTVCDDSWDVSDAAVVCKQLNYSTENAVALGGAYYGEGTGPIFLDDTGCSAENDSMLIQCFLGQNVIGSHNCRHTEDAGVICQVPGRPCVNGDIRLVGGANEFQGRVELCLDGVWGTVCDNFWTDLDATVVCRQLTLGITDSVSLGGAHFGQGSGAIHLDSFFCQGREQRITDCIHRRASTCTHAQDASVICSNLATCADGEIRLVDGSSSSVGRVEICLDQQYGTVCDDFWDNRDAMVVCRQLGFSAEGAIALPRAFFGPGTRNIFLDNVGCLGNESSLINCTHLRDPSFCFHFEDASVLCPSENASQVCQNGALRLVGGSVPYEGNVEVCFNGQWGTICHDRWDTFDAQTVCKILVNTTEGALSTHGNYFTFRSLGPILLDEVSCNGTETSILQCISQDAGIHDCSHFQDAGVICPATNSSWPCQSGEVRLAEGSVINEGRVEICINGEWGTVCDDLWDRNDAMVVCNQLGYGSEEAVAVLRAGFGAGQGTIYLTNLQCNGSENSLLECRGNGPGFFCFHSEDAGVICKAPPCYDGDIRLVGGTADNEGTLEVCQNNRWAGTVCDDFWDSSDAAVACRQLGFRTDNAVALRGAFFGEGQGDILLDDVDCTGNESRLVNCSYDSTPFCSHFEDAGIICPPENANCTDGDIRLMDGTNRFEGRVEVCLHGRWGSVCDDDWDAKDAAVVCRQLGYTQNGSAYGIRNANFGQGSGLIYLDNVRCTGTEATLLACRGNDPGNHNCRPTEDAGVFCPFPGSPCRNGDVRLVGGANERQGRVEFCLGGQWGTVCADFYWDPRDAQVVCRQLGFDPQGASATDRSTFGGGEGPIFLSQLNCNGSESSLVDCPSPLFGFRFFCSHATDAGVICKDPTQTCPQGDVRLVGGTSSSEGRVEICFNDQWGTVCDDEWDTEDASVVCRQLNFSSEGAIATQRGYFGPGIGLIHLDQVECSGTELTLQECTHAGVGVHNCFHSEDAGVVCIDPTATCQNGEVRLVGGTSSYEGRVEICISNQWGTVCDDAWDTVDAAVVCRQLNFTNEGGLPTQSGYFGPGIGLIHLDQVECSGTELTLQECTHGGVGVHNCLHDEDAGVVCFATNSSWACRSGEVRLAEGSVINEGRVEICINGEWGTVCDDFWGTNDAMVVCNQLGYGSEEAVAVTRAGFGAGQGTIYLANLQCNGSESSLLECRGNGLGYFCLHSEDAGVICKAPPCYDGDIRLVGGTADNEGTLEVCQNNRWAGTVCDDFWDSSDAAVACRQLGFRTDNAVALRGAFFGQGQGDILLDDVDCTGNESRLVNCSYDSTPFCSHFEDAGIICPPENANCTDGDIRLMDGTNRFEGRVEVCLHGRWGSVCDDDWDAKDAAVVCRQLGYTQNGSAYGIRNANFGQGSGLIYLDNVRCTGTEATLLACRGNDPGNHNCRPTEDAGVFCPFPGSPCRNGDVRLVGGANERQGRVEFCLGGQWGTVCADFYWDSRDAQVVCRQLGFDPQGASATDRSAFGGGEGPIFLNQLICNGSESSLVDCPLPSFGLFSLFCNHDNDAGVVCRDPTQTCPQGDVRLVGGTSSSEGRVEICFNNQWGTVCDDAWDTEDASVVCRQLNFSSEGAIATQRGYFGPGIGLIHLDQVECSGTELTLQECTHAGVGVHNCLHSEDAGVVCIDPLATCQNGEVRLVGGTSSYEGRVEICINNQWGTVCDDAWDTVDAAVVCRQLNFTNEGGLPTQSGYFGPGIGLIHLDQVECSGTELTLQECTHGGVGVHNCVHNEDAGVVCFATNSSWTCQSGEVRLAEGSVINEGRVEICINGEWGTVCDDFWGTNDAMVVCNQLGYGSEEAVAVTRAQFGAGQGTIYLANLQCNGSESSLLECRGNGLGYFCLHSEDAGVICKAPPCYDGDIRLVGGTADNEGTLEVCQNNRWAGTVCDDFWDGSDAAVACRQLGFRTDNAVALRGAFFGQGQGDILLDDVDCTGNESRLVNCSYDSTPFCSHFEDAGIICPPENANCTDGDIRLMDGTNRFEGRVEVCLHGRWGSVCDDDWDAKDAAVVCRQLGYTHNGSAYGIRNANFGQGSGLIYLDNVRCTGTEATLLACRGNDPGNHNCRPTEDAGVFCPYPGSPCRNGDVRLVGGESKLQGRVEFCLGGRWGTACANIYWDPQDAQVVCRQLGFDPRGAGAVDVSLFGPGEGPIFLSQLNCNGSESSLVDCPLPSFGLFGVFCSHANDAGVVCRDPTETCPQGALRLAGGATPNEGRVEICLNNQWGTVCDDEWDSVDAAVVCRQLNFTSEGAIALSRGFFGRGIAEIHLDQVECSGTELTLQECTHAGVGVSDCTHQEDAGVICIIPDPACNQGDLRLVGGSSSLEGRVEICVGGRWGTVCDDSWDTNDASVACRQLGFSPEGVTPTNTAFFGRGEGPIFIDDTGCVGNESRLIDCEASAVGVHNCRHLEDAGVVCRAIPCQNGTVRLVGGASNYSGRVEMCMNAEWGTLCGDSFTQEDAMAVCNKLGYQSTGVIRSAGGFFGRGSGNIFMGVCTAQSPCSMQGATQCDHSRDAGVFCPEAATAGMVCVTGAVRLAEGSNGREGRVEVCVNNVWGTVCDDSWENPSAAVVCKQLNLPTDGATAVPRGQFGQGSGPILLDNVKCMGEEANLLSCPQLPSGISHDCRHSEDAGVQCGAIPCQNGTVRLVGGANNYSGRVEVCVNGKWGTVCGDSFTQEHAVAVCSRLGYRSTGAIRSAGGFFGRGSGNIFMGVCTAQSPCSMQGATQCDHSRDAGTFCQETKAIATLCRTGNTRLMGGSSGSEGRVEVCFNNTWGTVCDDSWDDQSAKVVCRQLGLSTEGATAVPGGQFGEASGPILLDNVKCMGEEVNLLSCPQLPSGISHDCRHSEDAGVQCGGTTTTVTGAPVTQEQVSGGGNTVAIVVPVLLVILIIVLVIVVAVAVVLIYRAHRSGRFSPRKLDEIPITRTESFSEQGGGGNADDKTDIL